MYSDSLISSPQVELNSLAVYWDSDVKLISDLTDKMAIRQQLREFIAAGDHRPKTKYSMTIDLLIWIREDTVIKIRYCECFDCSPGADQNAGQTVAQPETRD